MAKEEKGGWRNFLRKFVDNRPPAIIKLSEERYGGLLASRKGMTEFTLNLPHDYLREVAPPCLCIISGTRITMGGYGEDDVIQEMAYVGVIKSKKVTSTFDTRIKVERIARVTPAISGLPVLIEDARFAQLLSDRIRKDEPITRLSPKLSVAVIEAIAKSSVNHGALRMVAGGLQKPPADTVAWEQTDAIDMALKAFGLSGDAPAANLELVEGKDTRLVGARIMEDAVIEHDARSVPDYKLVGSDMTGRAMFRNGAQTLEVITANRNKLEEAFGVDLIYVNHSRSNVVMVQYKMLRPTQSEANDTGDWVYTQDRHLAKQMKAMEGFASHRDCQGPYRLSHEIFYFKFVRRYGASKTSSVLIPLEHLQEIMRDQKQNGRSGSLRLGYNALEGRYMRQSAFYNLLQSGYIGAGTSTTNALTTLIQDLLRGGNALVLAIQRETTKEEDDSDRERAIGLWNDRDAGVH